MITWQCQLTAYSCTVNVILLGYSSKVVFILFTELPVLVKWFMLLHSLNLWLEIEHFMRLPQNPLGMICTTIIYTQNNQDKTTCLGYLFILTLTIHVNHFYPRTFLLNHAVRYALCWSKCYRTCTNCKQL